MKIPPRLRQLLRPSLGKVGLLGIALCLALGVYAPPAPINLAAEQPVSHPPLTAQAQIAPIPRR
ncbi:MAG: hypothetical protein ACRES4_05525 [Nevskiales bacterium]